MRSRRKPKTRYHHGDLRAALIECGLELIERKGIHALTLREIGKQLGVSRSAAYKHFKDKADMLFAISEAGFIKFSDMVEAARKDAGDSFAEQMDAMALAYARFADEHRAEFEVMFAAVLQPGGAAEAGGGRNLRILEEAIRQAQQTGEVRQDDPALLARVVWALVHGASMLRKYGDSVEPPLIRFSTEVLRSGLSSRQTPAMPDDKMFDPDQMQSIVDKLKAEGRMPTPEKLDAVIGETRANYEKAVAKATKADRLQAKKRTSKRTS